MIRVAKAPAKALLSLPLVVSLASAAFGYTAPSTPLKTLPLLRDSGNRLIGPVAGNYTIIPLSGEYVGLNVAPSGFTPPYVAPGQAAAGLQFFHAAKGCAGPRLMQSALIPTGLVVNGVIYFPIASNTSSILSIETTGVDPSKPGTCQTLGAATSVYAGTVKTTSVSSLGFTPPFVAESP